MLDSKYAAIDQRSFCDQQGQSAGQNTEIEVMYRDASNYKERFTVVLPGVITLDEAKALIDSLDDNENFLPGLVGLGVAEWSSDGDGAHYGDDHPFHEIDGIALTDRASDYDGEDDVTAQQMVARFVAIGPHGWIVPKKKRQRRAAR